MVTKTTTKAGKNKKTLVEKRRSHLNHKFFSEKFICDPLNAFPKPLRTTIFRIMW